MTGTSAGGRKAAITAKSHDPFTFSKRGHIGGIARQSKSKAEKSAIALKAAATRKLKDPDVFRKMGEKGGARMRQKRMEKETHQS